MPMRAKAAQPSAVSGAEQPFAGITSSPGTLASLSIPPPGRGGAAGKRGAAKAAAAPLKKKAGLPMMPPPIVRPRPRTIEERLQSLRELQARATAEQRAELAYRLEVSWIHHDSAIEGTVFEPSELVATLTRMQQEAAGTTPTSTTPASPVQEEIRQHKMAIDFVRQLAQNKKEPITLDTLRDLYAILVPDDSELKGTLRYRKDMPLHRIYFHEIATPDKIPLLMRQLVQWLDSEETRRTMHPTRIASRAHYKLLRTFPFTKHSGKVARLLMNLLLLREGYPPVILHATDRQRYYDAVKVSSDATAKVVNDALENGIESELRYWHRLFGLAIAP